jgi:hypothetical protein
MPFNQRRIPYSVVALWAINARRYGLPAAERTWKEALCTGLVPWWAGWSGGPV